MTKIQINHEETGLIVAKYLDPRSEEYLDYKYTIQIKSSGKQPVLIKLKFSGTPPYAAPMPPEEHSIKALNIIELYAKLDRWFSKFGYNFE